MALVTPCIGAASILAKTLTDDAETYCNFVKLPEILDILIDYVTSPQCIFCLFSTIPMILKSNDWEHYCLMQHWQISVGHKLVLGTSTAITVPTICSDSTTY